MSREYRIESSHLPLSYFGGLSHPAVRGVYLEELPYSVSGTSEISSEHYSIIEDDLMNVEGISDISCPFTHSYAAYIYISESGTYRFYVRANFGAEATIYDGEHGVSTGVTCGAQAESSSVEEITFADRGYYKVEVKYYSTGEASPVLELHFGESSPDMASRSELPVFRDAYEAVLSATTNIQLYSDLALDNFRRAIDDLSNLNNSCACSEAIGEFWGGHNDKCKRKLI